MANSHKPDDDHVGYGKPPKRTRFKKGESGNPKGRPKGTRNLRSDLSEELQELIFLREGGRDQHVSKQRALLKSLMSRAVQGDGRAADTILKLVLRLLAIEDEPEPEAPLTEWEESILDSLKVRLLRRSAGEQSDESPSPGDTLPHDGSNSTNPSNKGYKK